jgi:hypothetical protein
MPMEAIRPLSAVSSPITRELQLLAGDGCTEALNIRCIADASRSGCCDQDVAGDDGGVLIDSGQLVLGRKHDDLSTMKRRPPARRHDQAAVPPSEARRRGRAHQEVAREAMTIAPQLAT